MKIGLATWNGLISPVFDTTRHLTVVTMEAGQTRDRREIRLPQEGAMQRTGRIRELQLSLLVCGAISQPLARMISASGVELIPFVAGTTEEVIQAYLTGNLPNPELTMPGCQQWCQRKGKGRGRGREGRGGGGCRQFGQANRTDP